MPSWVSVERGRAPLVLVAPHGGRRHAGRHPGKHKVNDLWTAELTRELATATGATAIVNAGRDRNELDLNRLSQVVRDAPWFLELLAEVVGDLVAEAGHVTVLVIHGWNVTQPACDVGVGLRESGDGLVPVRPDASTVAPEFVRTRLRALQQAASADGIAVTIGARYPAAHPNNLLQAFRRPADSGTLAGPLAVLAALSARGAVDAAQLELAIPLRWPGPHRERFAGLLIDAFAPATPARPPRPRPAVDAARPLAVGSGRVSRRLGLQLIAGDLLVLAGVDASDDRALGGRLLIGTGGGRLALFTGELSDPERPWCVPPLVLRELEADGLEVRFDGALLEFPVLTPFLDLEHGLSVGTLVAAEVMLTFTAMRTEGDERFGDVRGAIVITGVRHSVATCGVVSGAERFAPSRMPSLRVTLPASPWGPLAFVPAPEHAIVDHERGRLAGRLVAQRRDGMLHAECAVRWSRTAGTIELAVGDGGPLLTGRLERLIPIRRPGRDGAVIEGTYAVVRFATGDLGWAEIAVVAPAALSD